VLQCFVSAGEGCHSAAGRFCQRLLLKVSLRNCDFDLIKDARCLICSVYREIGIYREECDEHAVCSSEDITVAESACATPLSPRRTEILVADVTLPRPRVRACFHSADDTLGQAHCRRDGRPAACQVIRRRTCTRHTAINRQTWLLICVQQQQSQRRLQYWTAALKSNTIYKIQ